MSCGVLKCYGQGPLDDGSADRAHDRDDPLDQRLVIHAAER